MAVKILAHATTKFTAKGPCKRTQHCWPTTPNIVGPNNVVTCCVRLHGTTTMLALVAYSLKPVKLLGPCKRTQHCWSTTPNIVGSCWHLLRPFAWALTLLIMLIISFKSRRITILLQVILKLDLVLLNSANYWRTLNNLEIISLLKLWLNGTAYPQQLWPAFTISPAPVACFCVGSFAAVIDR